MTGMRPVRRTHIAVRGDESIQSDVGRGDGQHEGSKQGNQGASAQPSPDFEDSTTLTRGRTSP